MYVKNTNPEPKHQMCVTVDLKIVSIVFISVFVTRMHITFRTSIFGSTVRWTMLLGVTAISLWFMLAYILQQLLKCLLMYHGYMFEKHG